MGWKLSDGSLEKYSPAEQKLFQLLTKTSAPISSTKLVGLFYNGKRMPVHGRTSMNVSLKRLMQKIDQNKEPFRLVREPSSSGRALDWCIKSRVRGKRQ